MELAPDVVQFDNGQRLDEDRRAGGGYVVDDASDATLEIGFGGLTPKRRSIVPFSVPADLQVGGRQSQNGNS
ncbi:MAG: hypothetical protein DRP96_10500 [Candidatus Neomarinimicrobiota bacterium]|nr:MAG: hypothetical protein DRP96_10500 [Candidatus Neomarinimicrobiota bacterium]